MKTYRRIVVGLIILVVFWGLFVLTIELVERTKNYKYLTYENTWGISNSCYNDKGDLSCETENGLIRVTQYYEE